MTILFGVVLYLFTGLCVALVFGWMVESVDGAHADVHLEYALSVPGEAAPTVGERYGYLVDSEKAYYRQRRRPQRAGKPL
jgi:hypothetical protein